MRYPTNTPVTVGFGKIKGYPLNDGFHKGVDFADSKRDPFVYMPEDGPLICRPNNGNDGNGIYIQVGNRMHGLCHNERFLVPSGSFQREGTPIAIMGDSGYAEGRHCHWAVRVNGVYVDGRTLVPGGKGGETVPAPKTIDWSNIMDEKTAKAMYTGTLHRDPESEDAWRYWIGRTPLEFLNAVISSAEWKQQNHILLKAYPELQKASGATPHQLAAERAMDAIEQALNTK